MSRRTLALRHGPPWPPIPGTEDPGSWPDWHLTSSGVAHHIIPSVPFRPPTLQVRGAGTPRHLPQACKGERWPGRLTEGGGARSPGSDRWRAREPGCLELEGGRGWGPPGRDQGWRAGLLSVFKLTSRAFYPVRRGGAPGPSRQAGFAHLGLRRGHQQMGDHLWLGLRGAQDPRRALRAAQGPKAEGSRAVCGDEGFRRKGKALGSRGPRGTGLRTAMPSGLPSGWVPAWSSCSSHAAAGASR